MAYDYIKNNIIEGRWGNDVRLVEQDISNELSISRTPIREAINSLIDEGYLEKETNRGVTVKKQIIAEKEFIESKSVFGNQKNRVGRTKKIGSVDRRSEIENRRSYERRSGCH